MNLKVPLIFSLLLLNGQANSGKLDELYAQLSWGSQTVGFRYVNARDFDRTYSRIQNPDGSFSTSQDARPVQIGIWYPARPDTEASVMSFLDYVALDEAEGRVEPLNEDDYMTATERYLSGDLWTGQPDTETLRGNLSIAMRAHQDAKPIPDSRFPVVIFAGHEFFGLSSNAVLHEFIASHGYVVVSFKNNTVYPEARDFKQHANATAQDIRFVKRFAEGLDNIDPERMIIAGNSLGALSIFDVALDHWAPWKGHDYPIRGIVSINGEIGSKYNPDYIGTSFPRMKISTIADYEIPLLHFRCKGNYWCNMQFEKIDQLSEKIDAKYAQFLTPHDLTGKDELSGMAFTSYFLITDLSSYKRFREELPRDMIRYGNQVAGFASMARIYLRHLDKWLCGDCNQQN